MTKRPAQRTSVKPADAIHHAAESNKRTPRRSRRTGRTGRTSSNHVPRNSQSPEEYQKWLDYQRKLTFEDRYPEILMWVDKRRRGIDLATIDWADIRQLILIRISQQYHIYNPAQSEFSHWVNTVITNTIRNIWRDHLAGFSRPCITGKGGCVENMGDNLCRRTPSGIQCRECPAYAEWEKRKGNHHAIRLPLPLDNHSQEVHSAPSDFVDFPAKELAIHMKMRERLTRTEWKVYRALIIQHRPEQEIAISLGFKKRKKGDTARMYHGYSVILAMKKKFVALARQIIEDHDLAA